MLKQKTNLSVSQGMNSIQESHKTKPLNLNHIIPLDFDRVHNLPDSHTWTPSGEYPLLSDQSSSIESSVPLIDLHDPNAILLVRQACEEWGVFQVTNHGIPMSLLEDVELQTRRLFTLPTEQKLRAVRKPDSLTGYGLARISAFFPNLMWSEGFSIMGSPAEHARQLWPNDHINFCNVMEEYQREMERLSKRMIGVMLRSLGLSRGEVKWLKPKSGSKRPQAVLHLNSYPICPDPSHAMGLAPHTDSSMITLLYQSSSTNGLQVYRDGIGWLPVQPLAGALVINVGDLMHILSNGKFKSTLHRAVVNKTNHRISAVYFYGPPANVKISPSTKLTNPNRTPLYRPVTWKEYLDIKATHFDKALEFVRFNVHAANK